MPTKKCVIAPDVALPTGGAPGAFMAVGEPERLIDELVRQGKRELTVIANGTMAQQTFIRLAPGEVGATPAPEATEKP